MAYHPWRWAEVVLMQILMQAVLIIQCYRSASECGAARMRGWWAMQLSNVRLKDENKNAGQSQVMSSSLNVYIFDSWRSSPSTPAVVFFFGGDFYGGCHLEGNGAVRERQRTCPVILPCVKGQCHDVKTKAVHVKGFVVSLCLQESGATQ